MSRYNFGRHDVRPESKVTQTIVRRGANFGKTAELEALRAANEALPDSTIEANVRGYRQGFFHGLIVSLLGGLLLYAATHLH